MRKKVRNKLMTIQTIILAVFLLAETVLFCCMFISRENASEKAITYKSRLELLHEEHNNLLLEKANLEYRNIMLGEENKQLNQKLSEALNVSPAAETQHTEPKAKESAAKERLPEGVATNRYDCEGYKFPAGTHQAMLQEKCKTDGNGTRFYINEDIEESYFCVAMGTAYGIDIGDAWRVTLKCGSVFKVILSDYQHDITNPDPDDFGERFEYDKNGNVVGPLRNYDGEECVHVLEFIVDLEAIPQIVKDAGGMHGLTFFGGKFGDGGNIVKIEYLGRVWEP